jgi:Ca2+-transporting ATPase
MRRRPRAPEEPVIDRMLGIRLGLGGILIAVGTLLVVWYGVDRYGLLVGTTMGLTAGSLMHIIAALEWRDPYRSIFNADTLSNGRLVQLILVAIGLTFLATTVNGLQRILDTADLGGDQWRVCMIAVFGYLALAEIGKFALRALHVDDVGKKPAE